jgi:hypothetical protein
MSTTSVPTRPDPTRTGAVWVTGTGAFLLLAAAAVFTAVRWAEIPAVAKLGALALATGACLVSGRSLGAKLPATAGALFHLGAFLVPLDVAALGVRRGLTWDEMLLVQGVVATLVFAWAASVERSVVLRWSAIAATVALAGGIGATTPVPPTLLLVGLAAAAVVARREHEALGWAGIAALAPVISLGVADGIGSGTMERLGLATADRPVAALLAAVGAGAVIAAVARRRQQPDVALVGFAVAAASALAAWFGADLEPSHGAVALGATFFVVQLASFTFRDDAFWRIPTTAVATIGEVLGRIGLALLGILAVAAIGLDSPDRPLALAAALLATGWAIADRRPEVAGVHGAFTVAMASSVAAVALASANGVITALALAAVAASTVLLDRRGTAVVGVIAALSAPVLAWGEPLVLGAVGIVGGLVVGEQAVRRSRDSAPSASSLRSREDAAWALTLFAPVAPLVALWGIADATDHLLVTLVAGAIACTGLAAWLDRGTSSTGFPMGTLARVAGAAMLVGSATLEPDAIAIVAAVVTVCSMGDALRLRHAPTALGASIGAPVAVGAFLHSIGLATTSTGIGLAVTALVLTGLGSLLGRTWALPTAVAAGVALAAAFTMASSDPTTFAHVTALSAAVIALAGCTLQRVEVLGLAGVVACAGTWLELGAAHVTAVEPYLLPVVAVLLAVGERSRRSGSTSSWIAHGPAIFLLGGSALNERMAGGAGWHAVVAGAVGVAAVAIGGSRRLGGPLVIGTGLLVAVVGYESLAITAGLPTWTWLGLGGLTLLGAGVVMERHEVGPLETGRRLVDVVNDRFA